MGFKKFTQEERKEYAVKKNEEFKKILEDSKKLFIEKLEEGAAPWQRPWIAVMPINFTNKNYYKGHNILMLSLMGEYFARQQNRTFDPRFCTPKMAAINKWKFDKENGHKYLVSYIAPKPIPLKEHEIENIDLDNHKIWMDEEETIPAKLIFVNKCHELYNISDLSGDNLPSFESTYNIEPNGSENWCKGHEIENLLEKLEVNVTHGGNSANYALHSDTITMPPKNVFISEEAYYSTLLHELCHWTGHKDRLDRGLEKYSSDIETRAKEEVIAEMSSYILCCHFGIHDFRSEEERQQALSYTQNWLSSFSKEDKIKAYDEASKEADKIYNFISKHLELKQEQKEDQEENYSMSMR